MSKAQNTNKYQELEKRTFNFAKECRDYVKALPKSTANQEYGRQFIRSSGSQAANYIEANESLSKRDFRHRIKICRKETKESNLWTQLTEPKETQTEAQTKLDDEAESLRKIFSAILEKSK